MASSCVDSVPCYKFDNIDFLPCKNVHICSRETFHISQFFSTYLSGDVVNHRAFILHIDMHWKQKRARTHTHTEPDHYDLYSNILTFFNLP